MSLSSNEKKTIFYFKNFSLQQDRCAMKVGTDAVLLGAWAPLPQPCRHILDIGTGTGVLSLMLAQRCPEAEVVGVEIDAEAAAQASENAAASPYTDRLRIEAKAIQDYRPEPPLTFDLIVSNPPFFTGGVLSDMLDRQSARHTVRLSHQDLLRSVQQHLSADGTFCLVLPKLEGLRFIEIAASMQLYPHQQLAMRPRSEKGINRLCIAFKRQPCKDVVYQEIVQYEGDSTAHAAEFAALMADYLRGS